MSAGFSACAEIAGADASDEAKEIDVVIEPERDDHGDLVPVIKSAQEWKEQLTGTEYRILREKGTERAFTGRYHDTKNDGVYACAGCGLALFDSETKFDSGTGWPSFYEPIVKDHVADLPDNSFGMRRVENVCARCGGHLGHVFPDGPRPTGLRYCINGYSLRFIERAEYQELVSQVEAGGEMSGDEAAE
ncbi:MAG: peptide-methionine (R)-S-oxide reductase MsrB [Planctomycetota bacterium]